MYGTTPTYTIFYNNASHDFSYSYYYTYNDTTSKSYSVSVSYDYSDSSIEWVTDISTSSAHTFQPGLANTYTFEYWETYAWFDWKNTPVFEDVTSMSNYFLTGSLAGSNLAPDYSDPDTYDENFTLTGFTGNKSITASWTGVSERSNLADEAAEIYVAVALNYIDKQDSETTKTNWLETEFDYNAMTLSYDISGAKDKYDDMYLDTAYVVPCYKVNGTLYHGKPSIIYLGDKISYDVPQSGDLQETSSSDLYLSCPSDFTVTIPKAITLDSDKKAEYSISITGSIRNNEILTVKPQSSVITMSEADKLKSDITGTITQTNYQWTDSDISQKTAYSGTVSVPDLSAGQWTGKLIFSILLQENTN
jgi:hypothetical protein